MKNEKIIKLNGANTTVFLSLLIIQTCIGQSTVSNGFDKITITNDFISEGVAVADFNNDGHTDIVAGYYWFEAPSWKRHEIHPSRTYDPRKEYSNSFLNLAMDVNLDGWMDVVVIDFPGKPGFWFENPKNKEGHWQKHFIANKMGISNESPAFVDVDKDGRLDILCGDFKERQMVWLQAPLQKGETEWKRHELTQKNVPGTEIFSHGLGYGDLNQDGYKDIIVREGWFEGTADIKSGKWTFHPANIGEPCSHMHVFDVNRDGKNDILSASAHKLGVWWHEQISDQYYRTHLISKTTAQTHATVMADLDGNGIEDLITGKRFLAHHGRDPGDSDPAFLIWIEFTEKAPYFIQHVIDDDSGVGLNIAVADMNKDGSPDIVISNKKGVFMFENRIGQ